MTTRAKRRSLSSACRVAVLVAAVASPLAAQGITNDFDAAKAKAIAAGHQLLVFCTGSDWDPASAAFVAEQLGKARVVEALAATHDLAHLDLRLRPQDTPAVQERGRVADALRRLGVWRFDQMPCIVLFDAKGCPRGRTFVAGGRAERTQALVRELAAATRHADAPGPEPERAAEHLVTGWSLVTQKKLAEARAEGLAAIADDASNAAAWDLLAVTAATLAKNQEVAAARAAVALTVIPERDPAPVQALAAQRWFRLGEALARQKRDAEAVFCYRQAMASDATHFAAGIASALLCQQRKDLAGAVRDADEVLRRDFGNVEALRIRSRCLPAKIAEGR